MLRKAKIEDAQAILNLICLYSEDGKMMFRPLEDIEQNITGFRVYDKLGEVVGICNLKYGWDNLVEIRSLGVDPRYHRQGIATKMIQDSIEQVLLNQNFDTVFVLTYAVRFFEKQGFQIIDKMDLPQKVWNDCNDISSLCLFFASNSSSCSKASGIISFSRRKLARASKPPSASKSTSNLWQHICTSKNTSKNQAKHIKSTSPHIKF